MSRAGPAGAAFSVVRTFLFFLGGGDAKLLTNKLVQVEACLASALALKSDRPRPNTMFGNNFFKIGDIFVKQKSGTAMGKKPAPPWATIFFDIKESGLNGKEGFIKEFAEQLSFYKRYLDDILGV